MTEQKPRLYTTGDMHEVQEAPDGSLHSIDTETPLVAEPELSESTRFLLANRRRRCGTLLSQGDPHIGKGSISTFG